MLRKEVKYPVLEKVEQSEFDERISFLHQSISGYPLCWMAFEQLEELLLDRKLRRGLFICKENNTIAIRSKTQRLLARIWFEAKPIEDSRKLYQWSIK
ncbi:MAG: hypothetical protein AAF843_04415 [Bacteroidota bacterium]